MAVSWFYSVLFILLADAEILIIPVSLLAELIIPVSWFNSVDSNLRWWSNSSSLHVLSEYVETIFCVKLDNLFLVDFKATSSSSLHLLD